MSIENRKRDNGLNKCKQNLEKFDDRTKYCLDFNRGKCKFDKGHEGQLNGQTVFKAHICKACLVRNGNELMHAEINCQAKK